MKSYNIQNYIRYKQDLEATLKRIESKEYIDYTRDELIKMYPIVFELCAEKGYNMTGRDHIIAFDTKRGV